MKYIVVSPFRDLDGSFKSPGDTVEAEGWRERALRQARKIGGRVEAGGAVENTDSVKAALVEKAKAMGIPATGRWGEEKLLAAIEAAEKASSSGVGTNTGSAAGDPASSATGGGGTESGATAAATPEGSDTGSAQGTPPVPVGGA